MAYSGKDNLEYVSEKEITAISKLNPVISEGNRKNEYNKDADMMQCRAGHLAKSKRKEKIKGNKNERIKYRFDITKCKECPYKEDCYKEGAKSKTYSVILCDRHKEQKEFQETEYFKNKMKERYKIEAKNVEIKQSHGLGMSKNKGLFGMQIQSYITAMVVNLKRIITLKTQKTPKYI